MAYYLDLFSPETYESFSKSGRSVSGFRDRQQNAASKLRQGDKLLCYMTKLSRWIGVLEVQSESYRESSPIFYPADDPFVIRFKVHTIAWLPKEKAVPIHEERVWNQLSFTRGLERTNPHWTGKFRSSLNLINDNDGQFLENLIVSQLGDGEIYPIDDDEYEKLITHKAHRVDKVVTVSVPTDQKAATDNEVHPQAETRESTRVQALLAIIGTQMGFKIWLPKADRNAVLSEWKSENRQVLEMLPLNYDEATIKTIEQIDMLWLSGRSIVRAFEVEHTTSIYSGILRMADLLALQPNMNIRLHIVAPPSRREKAFQELLRPVFSLLDQAPLSERCTFLSYDSIEEIAKLKHLSHLSDSVLDEYAEEAE